MAPRRAATAADSRPRPVSRRRSAVARMSGEGVGTQRRGLAPAPLGSVAPEPGQHAIGARAAHRGAGQRGAEGDGGDHERGGRGGAAGVEERGEVGGERGIGGRLSAAPRVELAQGAGVGVAGVGAQGVVGQLARGGGLGAAGIEGGVRRGDG